MKIAELAVDNFCSIKHAAVRASNFNVFVGQNNHGKTNLFEAVSWFYSGKGDTNKLRFGRTGNADVAVEIEFSGVQDALAAMKNEKNRASIQNVLKDADTVRVKRVNDSKVRRILNPSSGEWAEKNPTGFDSAFNDFLPVFEYIDTKTRLEDVSKYGKTTAIGTMLSGVLGAILEKSQKYRDFLGKFEELFASPESEVRIELDKISGHVTGYIAKQFPDCTEVKFEISEPAFEELLKGISTDVDDGVKTEAGEKGDGMQRALMLAILQTYADFRKSGEATGKNFLFFIDEAEMHLHPTAQRKLKVALQDVSGKGDQVFLNTHSSVLVADDHPDQKIFRVEKTNKETKLELVSPNAKPAVVYELLGGSPADLLLPNNFLIVEGRSDFEFISHVIDRFYPDKPRVQIVYSEGDSERQRKSMDAINLLFNPLFVNAVYKNRLVILCDRPATDKAEKDLERFRGNYRTLDENRQLFVLPERSLEECYPGEFKKNAAEVEELGRSLFLKRELAKYVGQQISREDFEIGMPLLMSCLDQCWRLSYR